MDPQVPARPRLSRSPARTKGGFKAPAALVAAEAASSSQSSGAKSWAPAKPPARKQKEEPGAGSPPPPPEEPAPEVMVKPPPPPPRPNVQPEAETTTEVEQAPESHGSTEAAAAAKAEFFKALGATAVDRFFPSDNLNNKLKSKIEELIAENFRMIEQVVSQAGVAEVSEVAEKTEIPDQVYIGGAEPEAADRLIAREEKYREQALRVQEANRDLLEAEGGGAPEDVVMEKAEEDDEGDPVPMDVGGESATVAELPPAPAEVAEVAPKGPSGKPATVAGRPRAPRSAPSIRWQSVAWTRKGRPSLSRAVINTVLAKGTSMEYSEYLMGTVNAKKLAMKVDIFRLARESHRDRQMLKGIGTQKHQDPIVTVHQSTWGQLGELDLYHGEPHDRRNFIVNRDIYDYRRLSANSIVVDFANKRVGGGCFGNGWVQEEQMVAQSTDLQVLLREHRETIPNFGMAEYRNIHMDLWWDISHCCILAG